jgi:hypothetical protein
MAFVVVYDANVLYPSTLRDVLIHVGLTGLVQSRSGPRRSSRRPFEIWKENGPTSGPSNLPGRGP